MRYANVVAPGSLLEW